MAGRSSLCLLLVGTRRRLSSRMEREPGARLELPRHAERRCEVKADDYHRHLDQCPTCNSRRGVLCEFGEHLFNEAVSELHDIANGSWERAKFLGSSSPLQRGLRPDRRSPILAVNFMVDKLKQTMGLRQYIAQAKTEQEVNDALIIASQYDNASQHTKRRWWNTAQRRLKAIHGK